MGVGRCIGVMADAIFVNTLIDFRADPSSLKEKSRDEALIEATLNRVSALDPAKALELL